MNEDYLMQTGDKYVARECGCSMTVITGPMNRQDAKQNPQCCCGHDMMKDSSFIGGIDVVDIPEPQTVTPRLAGMVE